MHAPEARSNQPKGSNFRQQRLAAWLPLLTPVKVIISFVVIGVVFSGVGIVLFVASSGVVEVEYRYDGLPMTNNETISLTIPDYMESPIYVYYKLRSFYQNHRRYVKSRSNTQLRGDPTDTTNCEPLKRYNGSALYPCGLVANSVFNDTFVAAYSPSGVSGPFTNLTGKNWKSTGIAWDSDMSDLFKHKTLTPQLQEKVTRVGPGGFELPEVDNEDFVVWMRTAGLPTFRKLYRKIEQLSFKSGSMLNVTINNAFPVSEFGGEKSLVLSTVSWLGGKNNFLGVAYITMGVLCLLMAISFFIKYKVSPRALGDIKFAGW